MDSGQERLNRYRFFQSFDFKDHKSLSAFVRSLLIMFKIINIIPNGKGGFVLFIEADREIVKK